MTEKLFQITGHIRIVAPTAKACDELATQTLARINLVEPCAHLEVESSREEPTNGGHIVHTLVNATR